MPMMATRKSAPRMPNMIKTVFRVVDIFRSSVLCEYARVEEKVYKQEQVQAAKVQDSCS